MTERQQFHEPPLGLQELDVLHTRLEEMAREIRRLRAWREAISAGDNVRATSISGTVGVGSGGSGSSGSMVGAVSLWQNNSGATQTQGTVVTHNGDRLFGVTTTARDRTVIGVLDDASVIVGDNGRVRHGGYQSVVTVQNAVAVGDFLAASTTSGAASSVGVIAQPGVFAIALTAKVGAGAGTVTAWVFPPFYGLTDAPIELNFAEGGAVLSTGIKADISVPYDATIGSWRLLADQVGSIVFDIWRDTYAAYPPTVADTITGTDKPTLSAVIKNENAGPLTNWGAVTLSKGETLRINIDSCATITSCNLTLGLTRR
jgi:hypothetical protein